MTRLRQLPSMISGAALAALLLASTAGATHNLGFGHNNVVTRTYVSCDEVVFGTESCFDVVTFAAESAIGGYSSGGPGIRGIGLPGVFGESASDVGVLGRTGSTTHLGAGVFGEHTSANGASPGVRGNTNSTADQASGVIGEANAATGGNFSAGVRAHNHATNNQGAGLWASHDGAGHGIYSTSVGGIGAEGLHVQGNGTAPGVKGWTASGTNLAAGVFGEAPNGTQTIGVLGSGGGFGVLGVGGAGGLVGYSTTGPAGLFFGNVHVQGTLSKSAGSFRIDHPLDPQRKYLQHSFVESPDMKNVYDGVVRTDRRGFATVRLPRYFQALNRDFRYQLTSLSGLQDVAVAREIAHNRFVIQSEKPRSRVSWQVTGIRKDRYANEHRIRVEVEKTAADRRTASLAFRLR